MKKRLINIFFILFSIFKGHYAIAKLPNSYKIIQLGKSNQLFYISKLFDDNESKLELLKIIEEIRKCNKLNSEATLYLNFIEYSNFGVFKANEKEVLEYYNKYLKTVASYNSPLLSIELYHIPLSYYEIDHLEINKSKLVYYYQKIYWTLKNNPNLKYLGKEVEIMRIAEFYLTIDNFNFVRKMLQEHYDITSFSSPHCPNLAYYSIYHCNSLALCYFEIGELNKAIYFYELGKKKAIIYKRNLWTYIYDANLAEIFYRKGNITEAKILFKTAVDSLKPIGVKNIVAFSYLYLADISLYENNKAKALDYLNEAYPLIKELDEDKRWLKYFELKFKLTLAGQNLKLASQLKDTIYYYETKVKEKKAKYDTEELSLKILNENNDLHIRIKKDEILHLRLYVVFGLLVLGLFIYFSYKRYSKKYNKIKKDKEERDKKINSLETQLDQLIQEIIDKNESKATENINWEEFKLLTKTEWNKFLAIFTESYPKFIESIEINGIKLTEAEKRMAILIKLKIDTKTIASMLGISETSVWQAKARLKKKLNLDTNIQLVKFILES